MPSFTFALPSNVQAAVSAVSTGLTANIQSASSSASSLVSGLTSRLPTNLQSVVSSVTTALPSGITSSVSSVSSGLQSPVARGTAGITGSSLGLASAAQNTTASAANAVNAGIYAVTRNEDLTYSGTDVIVWDRINAERIRRNLPGLAATGFPRPAETSDSNAAASAALSGQNTFTVKGPDGLTETQARAIFNAQAEAGSFVGFKPGDVLSASTQAAAGLPAALSQVAQSLRGTTGIVDGNILKTAAGAASSVIPGGAASALGAASGIAGAALGAVKSVATKAVNTVTSVLRSTPITNGINVADFAKQAPALTTIGSLSDVDVRAGLAQAGKLVGQATDAVSNSLGAGKFGFDASQLETAGVLKAGTTAKFLSDGTNSLTDVLKSPAVYTGKFGVDNLDALLSSPAAQNTIQQNLMSTGIQALGQLGVPINSLSPTALAGTALNAAKSIPATEQWLKGGVLPADLKNSFNQVAKDASFAVDFANQNVNAAVKQEIIPIPASNTVNRDTLNAAAARITGSAKVPAVNYTNAPVSADPVQFGAELRANYSKYAEILTEVIQIQKTPNADLLGNPNFYLDQINSLTGQALEGQSQLSALERRSRVFEKQLGSNPFQSTIDDTRGDWERVLKILEKMLKLLQDRINQSTTQ